MKEIWKDIPSYEGYYQASTLGRIKSLKYWSNVQKKYYDRELILKTTKDKGGYPYLTLSKNGVKKTVRVHKLIALTFVPNPNNYRHINHINKNKECNLPSNLEWCTQTYNTRYSKAKVVKQYDLDGNFIKEWVSINEAMNQTNIKHIWDCCKGKRKTAGSYIWRYDDGLI